MNQDEIDNLLTERDALKAYAEWATDRLTKVKSIFNIILNKNMITHYANCDIYFIAFAECNCEKFEIESQIRAIIGEPE